MTALEYIVDNREECISYAESCLPADLVSHAEDVVQDLTLYYIARSGGGEPQNPKAYVNKAIANTCNSLRRQERRRTTLREDNDNLLRTTFGYDSIAPDASDVIEAEDLEKEIFEGMSELEKGIYQAIVIDGKSYKEAAEDIFFMSEAAVRQHISRIKKRFNNGR